MAIEKATFAGGCFWCMVQPFDQLPGIKVVESGYMGGTVEAPSYEQVKTGETGHLEVVQITFDSALFPYEKLLELYWPQIDPTDEGGQFQDRGSQYTTAIFYHSTEQQAQALATKQEVADSGRFKKPIVTAVRPAEAFYLAEQEHQDFYKKEPSAYKADRKQSGRDEFIEENWQRKN
ncbi:peptide-methionine (S)-S-oxide reductase [Alkalihalobacillus xiaoxiensis]|uniref:Peptide methionine sulfoxide reductase MsrA n=1 Tax=Shouchella xiaoxiensis TaxID=766895 RepID=A0ABS2T250_9BACI|nr:peptide-methionine (S)-S-oxide reductase MsrA [Shouchella xiaoxiensis]MBM7840774.1 peptide-methionine (S)-S-oxide reductase [Shouchella xiaoxiensis]